LHQPQAITDGEEIDNISLIKQEDNIRIWFASDYSQSNRNTSSSNGLPFEGI
jgi:hypothetical protein